MKRASTPSASPTAASSSRASTSLARSPRWKTSPCRCSTPTSPPPKRAAAALAEVGLETRAHLRPAELSGGEKQRVAIARALVKNPHFLFADEPTSALDKHNGEIVIDLLKRIAEEHGATVLGVTHDPRLLSHADRVIGLEDGVVTSDARRNERPLPLAHETLSHA